MVYLSSAAWMLSVAVMCDRARMRDHVLTFGLGLGALLAALLVAVPAAGTALGTLFPNFGGHALLDELIVTQGAWIIMAACAIAGYGLSRLARRVRSPRALVLEVVALGAAAALVPASLQHLTLLLVLVPAAVAGVAATLLEEVERPASVLAGLLATAAFAAVFVLCRAVPALGLPQLVVGSAGLAYAVGRWTDLHPVSVSRPGVLLWVALAGGFLLGYKL
ncbi:MAG TPA: hypothetical protein VKF59_07390 [Candidatus Dormibacteraeota bacterium]|nr:hypothetical protein [Candidatus Dormibacteraeota bacterium]